MAVRTTIFFASDIHGSDVCFRKLLSKTSKVDFLIIGGDVSGKGFVPIIEKATDDFYVPDLELQLNGEEKVVFETRMADKGIYTFTASPEEHGVYQFDKAHRAAVQEQLQVDRLRRWMQLARERLSGSKTQLIINCGNDDPFSLDDVIRESGVALFPEGLVVPLTDELALLSIGYSSRTPWECAREATDDDLRIKIAELVKAAKKGNWKLNHCVFNFHCPPKNTLLDSAPVMRNFKQVVGVNGQVAMEHVGSDVIREAILNLKPVLALHGHIHESRAIETIGSTTCINPGSCYWTGSLQGAMIVFEGPKLIGTHLTSEKIDIASSQKTSRVGGLLLKGVVPGIGHVLEHVIRPSDKSETIQTRVDKLEARLDAIANPPGPIHANTAGTDPTSTSKGGKT